MKTNKRTAEYWERRFVLLKEAEERDAASIAEHVQELYEKAEANINKRIRDWYMRFAKNNDMTPTEARKLLNSRELKELRWSVEEYIEHGEENALSGAWIKQLENASAKYHINRLEALKLQLRAELEQVVGKSLDATTDAFEKNIEDNYLRTAYETQKGIGLAWEIVKPNYEEIKELLGRPWSLDNRTFSDRIWTNKEKLIRTVENQITQMVMTGAAPDDAIKTIEKTMEVSKRQAGRLVMTESAYFAELSKIRAYKDLGVKEYQIVATLDIRTSEICRELDSKHFLLKDAQVGVTYPPFHPNCRSTTAPYFKDEFGKPGKRAARDVNDDTVYVDDNLTYKEWHEKFVETDPRYVAKEKAWKNRFSDKKQYERYMDVLGADVMPKRIEDFQKMKYGISDGYTALEDHYYVKSRLKDGRWTDKINIDKQRPHNELTHDESKSFLFANVDAQELIDEFAGTGEVMKNFDGARTNKEIADCGRIIGFDTRSGRKTSQIKIHYSNGRTHVVPYSGKKD